MICFSFSENFDFKLWNLEKLVKDAIMWVLKVLISSYC